nr:hypothetical protein [Tanacetum cinerariifolium]
KFIKFSVENLVPNPSESESESECDMPACEAFTTFSNILFDAEYDSDSSDDQSLSDEDFPKKIYSNPLFDEEIIPMKIDQHPFNAELLYDNSSPRLPEEFIYDNSDADIESFSPSPIPIKDSDSLMEEIDLSFAPDDPIPPGIEEDDYDSKRDILILEELLDNYSLSLPENKSYHFDIPLSFRPPAKPPNGPRTFQPSAKRPMIINEKNTPILDVSLFHFYPPRSNQVWGNYVKLSDLKQALRGRHPMLIKSDKFIKFSVENLVPDPSESEGESECDMPACEAFTTFSNILFDAEYDSDSSDDQSLSDEDFPKKIYSNPLFDEEIISMKIDPHPFNAESDLIESMLNHDSSIIISSKIDSLFDEFTGELTLLKSIPSGIDENDCYPEEETHFTKRLLYDNSSPRLPEEFVYDNSDADIESFSPSPIPIKDSDSLIEEIDLSFALDDPIPPGIEEDDCNAPLRKEDIGSLFDEFAGELTLLKSFPLGIDETDCHPEKEIRFAKRLLYDNSSPRPPKEIVSDISNADIESFSPSPIPNKDNDDDSERDIQILEELLDNYSLSLPTNESYHFDIPSPYRPPAKPPDGDTGTLNIKMMGDVSDQKVPIPNLTITRVLNQEKSPDLLSHQGFEAF